MYLYTLSVFCFFIRTNSPKYCCCIVLFFHFWLIVFVPFLCHPIESEWFFTSLLEVIIEFLNWGGGVVPRFSWGWDCSSGTTFPSHFGPNKRRGILLEIFLLFRKIFSLMKIPPDFLTKTTGFSFQMVSDQGCYCTRGYFICLFVFLCCPCGVNTMSVCC